jgi:hypothetical protein
MFCLDHLNVCELGEPKLGRLSSFKLRNNLFPPFVRIFSVIFKNNEVPIFHVFQQKDIYCEKMYWMKLHVVDFMLVLTQSASKCTLTDNCLKEMSANAFH